MKKTGLINKILDKLQEVSKEGASQAEPTDNELIERFVRSNDDKAFELIVRRYMEKIYNLAYRITRDHYKAEDVLQEVYMTLIKKLHTFRGESKFSSWLYRVTANASYMMLRTEKKYDNDLSLDDYVPYDDKGTLMGRMHHKDWSSRPDIVIYVKEALEILEKAVDELPEVYRVVFYLRDIEGLTNEEVSEVLEITVPAVKSRIHRSRLYIRDKVSDYFYEWKKIG
ncbi:MAG: sigma-70 family RNA polymerase sigma factor [Candidatus Dadabacteria bacterium]|nr:sigma-70 family RNA polymerase sigma factor [Candidatus Dadabacteria bacterium]NIS10234.1 sigma-70 family RNA polymerase sigma factor [Candidatus Dadabacteria bacterium]NIV42679.1 sigma-70 family RNA polymerase sigma factor [Candidatus Dadabacteria bacterium]NIX16603.1 sigma-70 family RNA polymerase sigma factor [Candidatus Dadabacteria bacterium]NIY23150.1 sigma-70 family RNA polymerase sigma factor [Candidatus Dadabacteria bacterium]